jgi:acyl-CoA synthetase (AMP-forming)/AMP-acid ligase II
MNSALYFIATLGILRTGGIWIPINPRNSTTENIQALKQFACKAVFFLTAFTDPVEAVAATPSSPG